MRQVIATLGSGVVEVVDVPRPRAGRGELVVANEYSVVSTGTERTLVTFGRSSLPRKLQRERGRLSSVVDKAVTDGIGPTVRAVRAKLDAPIPLGYSSAGVVLEVGEGVEGFHVGDRVAANGAHAEIVTVRARLAAQVPENVSSKDAAFGTMISVAMNALREADIEFGSIVAVVGLGLVGGLLTQVATAAGHRVVALDRRADRAEARAADAVETFGDPEEFRRRIDVLTRGTGADAVIIATDVGDRASGLDPMSIAGDVARRRATVVLAGDGDPTIDRRTWYQDELRFVVSHAYGPGRDDEQWETGVADYRPEHVRWTARENLELALELIARGDLHPSALVEREAEIDDALDVYDDLVTGPACTTLFAYRAEDHEAQAASLQTSASAGWQPALPVTDVPGIAVIGAGNFATRVLLPALAEQDVDRRLIVSRSGLSSVLAAREFGFASSTTNVDRLLDDPDVAVVFIATRHASHAELAARALNSGKHVWLEKPVAIDREGLATIVDAHSAARGSGVRLMVGFNRRFAPTLVELRHELAGSGPFSAVYTVNAGALPRHHWLRDRAIGGGRIVGEACHFVDVLRHLADAPIRTSHGVIRAEDESATLTFEFADGSIGTVHYLTGGHASVPKERLEVYAGGRVVVLDNFRAVEVFEDGLSLPRAIRRLRRPAQNKGHHEAVSAFLRAIRSGEVSPVPFDESVEVTTAIFDALDR